MNNCKFCNIPKGNVIIESELSLAFYDKYPVNKGHILVIPKNHISSYFNLSPNEKLDVWNMVDKIKALLENKYQPDAYNIGINIGEPAGQTIFHCHIHIIPRYNGDVDNPLGGVRGVIPSKQKY